jgi:hypothetical protein
MAASATVSFVLLLLKSELGFWQGDRLHRVFEYMNVAHQLCAIMGMDFVQIIAGVHPSLVDSDGGHPKSISNDTIARLAKTIHSLREEKKLRLQKVQIYPNSEIHCLAISGYCWMIF